MQRDATIRKFRIVQTEGARNVQREVEFYNLDTIIAVGYRVKSHRGTQFRQWATARLSEYHAFLDTQPRKVDLDFEQAVKQLPKAAPASKPARKPKPPTG